MFQLKKNTYFKISCCQTCEKAKFSNFSTDESSKNAEICTRLLKK